MRIDRTGDSPFADPPNKKMKARFFIRSLIYKEVSLYKELRGETDADARIVVDRIEKVIAVGLTARRKLPCPLSGTPPRRVGGGRKKDRKKQRTRGSRKQVRRKRTENPTLNLNACR